MSAFVEDDARLAGMHGYDPLAPQGFPALEAKIARLEAKLDALILALKAGAIGRWGNDAR